MHSLQSNSVAGTIGPDTVIHCAERQTVSIHLEVVSAAKVGVSLSLHGGNQACLLHGRNFEAGAHAVINGIPLGIGDYLTLTSDAPDTEFFIARGAESGLHVS